LSLSSATLPCGRDIFSKFELAQKEKQIEKENKNKKKSKQEETRKDWKKRIGRCW
jgi:hypothetical protein